jgi:hypothetical protein
VYPEKYAKDFELEIIIVPHKNPNVPPNNNANNN